MALESISPCEHGRLARHVLVMDTSLRTDRDPWGDIELLRLRGESSLAAAEHIRDREADINDDPDRFRLGFLHTDGCRTEETR